MSKPRLDWASLPLSVVTPTPAMDGNFVVFDDVIVVDLEAVARVDVAVDRALVVVVVVVVDIDILGSPLRIDGVVVAFIGRLTVVLDVVDIVAVNSIPND